MAEKLSPGMVRRSVETASFKVVIRYYPGEDWSTEAVSGFTQSRTTEEWVTAMDGSNVTELLRSYGHIARKDLSVYDVGKGPEEHWLDGTDWKSTQSFLLGRAGDGSRSIKLKPSAVIDEATRKLVCAERQPVLASGGAVKVGDTFKLTLDQLGLPVGFTPADKLKSHDLKATVTEITTARDAGTSVKLKLAFEYAFYTEQINEFDDAASSRYDTTVKLAGTGEFNVTQGRMVKAEWSGSAKAKGKLGGAPFEGSATLSEKFEFAYGTVIDSRPDNGDHGPTEGKAGTVQSEKFRPLAEHEIVIGRNNGKVTRIQAFDTKTRKIVKTLCVLPTDASLFQLSVSPDRKRVAFSSNLNSGISIFDRDVFVLELEEGVVNQVSPRWADNKGLAQALKTEETCTVTGRIVWHDDEFNRDRHDAYTGWVKIDHTVCGAAVKSDGTFTLTGVPVGLSLYMDINGRIPAYSNGKWRGATLLAQHAGASHVFMPTNGGTYDVGTIRIHGNKTTQSIGRPTWRGKELWVVYDGWNSAHAVGYPERTFKDVQFGKQLDPLCGGFAISPDGKQFAITHGSGSGVVGLYDAEGQWVKGIESQGYAAAYNSEGAWTGDSKAFCYTCSTEASLGESLYGAPGIGISFVSGGTSGRRWQQLTGQNCVSMALDQQANVGYLVIHRPDGNLVYGEIWAWDSRTDAMERITTMGDVICVGGYGR
ncbi:MAG: PD40 domain-containing protein [Planctomycetes bacterium]|nr:PD40 domain-containing protein [Planctomycetota bacterium]MCW8137044.1 PD40 domain-containing protein [Planctomycetota bacterium]